MYKKNNKKGFTLIEIIVSISILVILGLSVNAFLSDSFKFNRQISDNIENLHSAKAFLQKISAEIRSMSISNTGSFPITEAGTSSITFFSDTNSDNLKEQIKYYLQGDILYKKVIVPSGNPLIYSENSSVTTVIIKGINPNIVIFEYFDGNYAGTTSAMIHPINPSTVRLIRVNISVNDQTFDTQISIRNLKNSL